MKMKIRMARDFWDCEIQQVMLSSTSPREALLACPPSPPWNLLSFTVESTLTSSCSRCDPPLSRQVAATPLVISRIYYSFFRTGGVLSHRNSLTHKFPRFPPRNLCSLVMLAVFSLVYAATDTAFC